MSSLRGACVGICGAPRYANSMTPPRPPQPADSISDDQGIPAGQRAPSHNLVTMNQVVAYNLKRARVARGLTQTELGERLATITGTRWSRSALSAAEKGWGGETGRVRNVDADELLAYSLALDVPITWFFLPPAVDEGGHDVRQVVQPRYTAAGSGDERWAVDDGDLALRVLDVRGRWLGTAADVVEQRFAEDRLLRSSVSDPGLVPEEHVTAVANELFQLAGRLVSLADSRGEDSAR